MTAKPTMWSSEEGSSIVEDLLALMLLVLVFAVGVQAFVYAQAQSVATAAAQDGARTAASDGAQAGVTQAQRVIAAGGRLADHLTASVQQSADTVTLTVAGRAAAVFGLSLILPGVRANATDPLEQYPSQEQAANQ